MIEGFFGPEWNYKDRFLYADFLSQNQGGFYLFAPKRCHYLRKSWEVPFPPQYLEDLKKLRDYYKMKNIQFGVGLSPFDIYREFNSETKRKLQNKLDQIVSLGIDYLGIFFDDMKSCENMAIIQIDIIDWILYNVPEQTRILFCPSYYSFDPILDRVFGDRPKNYLDEIGLNVDSRVDIMWTGQKVISDEISIKHLEKVASILKRPPFIWENYFANDGPKNCHYLKLRPYLGRDKNLLNFVKGMAFNLMNQPKLSLISLQSVFNYYRLSQLPEDGLKDAIQKFTKSNTLQIILKYYQIFNKDGREKISDFQKEEIKSLLEENKENDIAQEIVKWLNGDYVVGPECLTD